MRTEDTIAAVSPSVNAALQLSIHCRSQQLGLGFSTTWKILRKDLGVPFKIKLVQELQPKELPHRRVFNEWALGRRSTFFIEKLCSATKLNFGSMGTYKAELSIFEWRWARRIAKASKWWFGFIGPYFFKDAANRNVTANGERYREMICNFFLTKIQELDLHDIWLQQDGATCHTARVTMALLRGEFGEHFISRSVAVNWPPRSGDLKHLGYFLWSCVKAHIYTDKPNWRIGYNIEAFIREIPAATLERVRQNWTNRMDHLKLSRRHHLQEIIFKH